MNVMLKKPFSFSHCHNCCKHLGGPSTGTDRHVAFGDTLSHGVHFGEMHGFIHEGEPLVLIFNSGMKDDDDTDTIRIVACPKDSRDIIHFISK